MRIQQPAKALIAALSLALLASPAAAQDKGNEYLLQTVDGDVQLKAENVTYGSGGTPGVGVVTDGTESWDAIDDADNIVMEFNIGAGNTVTGGSFDVNINSEDPPVSASWCSEATVLISNSDGSADPNGILLSPGASEGAPCNMEFSSAGVIDFSDNGLPNVTPNADGIIRLEFHESFDDSADEVDAVWGTHSAPALVQGLGFACTDQGACDSAFGGDDGPPETPAIPTLSTYGLIALALVMLVTAAFFTRRRLSE